MTYMTSMTSYFPYNSPLPRGQFDLELGSNIADCTVDLATLEKNLTTKI